MLTRFVGNVKVYITVTRIYDAIIIGGGQAGLVQGYYLQQLGLDFIILDANENIGGSWQHYWDNLTLFSAAQYSSLDGLPFPANPEHYPTRREVIAYLQQYAQHFDLPVQSNVKVRDIHKNRYFEVLTENDDCYLAKAVIAATGAFTKPSIPKFVGQGRFTGRQLHSFNYRTPDCFAGQRVVVVGSNNSAVQIACELGSVADVSLAVRKAIQFTPQYKWGKDVFFYLHDTGFDMLPVGCRFGLCVNSAVYDDGHYQAAVKAGNPDPRPMFTEITKTGVLWSDGVEETIDTIIYATGFSKSNKAYLANLDALDAKGVPLEHKGVSTTVRGLFYIGLEGQIAPASATLRGVSRDARYIARQVGDFLGSSH